MKRVLSVGQFNGKGCKEVGDPPAAGLIVWSGFGTGEPKEDPAWAGSSS